MDDVDSMLIAIAKENGTEQNLEDMKITLTHNQFKHLVGAINRKATFAPCSWSYDGTRNVDTVDTFLIAINLFKKIENISDEDALFQIPMLLRGEAGIWYCNTRDEIQTWEDFQTRLRKSFAPPAYVIFQEIYAQQNSEQTNDYFINRKRLLFSLLPPPEIPESQQLDMMYGSLLREIREKVPRESFNTFDKLLEDVEAIKMQKQVPSLPTSSSLKAPKPRCRYCRLRGHLAEECLKKKRAERDSSTQNRDSSAERDSGSSEALALPDQSLMSPMSPEPEPKFWCYGCGAPNVVRTKCPTCYGTYGKPPAHLRIDFH